MAKLMSLWRIYDGYDMALSDSYFPTRRLALDQVRSSYDVGESAFRPSADCPDLWEAGLPDGFHGSFVYLERILVEPTRAGIARALKNIPHR
jgi:hypothetical protein